MLCPERIEAICVGRYVTQVIRSLKKMIGLKSSLILTV